MVFQEDPMNTDTPTHTLTCLPEVYATSHKESKEMLVNAHIEAPTVNTDKSERAPVSITAVIDRSGSMSGAKITLVKETLKFVIEHLEATDSLGIVSYSDDVQHNLEVTPMTEEGKKLASQAADNLQAAGCTNLSGGLYGGIAQQTKRKSALKSQPAQSPTISLQVGNLFMGNTWVAFVSPTQNTQNASDIIKTVTFELPHNFSPSTVTIDKAPFELAQTIPTTAPVKMTVTLTEKYGNQACTFEHSLGYSQAMNSTTHNVALSNPEPSAPPSPVSKEATTLHSVWLFTDGLANRGDVSKDAITNKLQTLLTGTPCTVSTFGYGSDHNAELLQGISEMGHGMYYFMETPKEIGAAMIECLAGLLTVYATEVTLTLQAAPGAEILKIFSKFPTNKSNDKYNIKIGDIFGEEKRDILCRIKLHSLPCVVPDEVPAVKVELKMKLTSNGSQDTKCTDCLVLRPEVTPEDQDVPHEIDEQRNRVEAMEAMEKAKIEADHGNLTVARDHLMAAQRRVATSKSAASPFCADLQCDMKEMIGNMDSESAYQARGKQAHVQKTNMYAHQRACGGGAPRFHNAAQSAMVQSWNSAH